MKRALVHAVKTNKDQNLEIVKLLVESGAEISDAPIVIAIRDEKIEIVKFLCMSITPQRNLAKQASQMGSLESVKFLTCETYLGLLYSDVERLKWECLQSAVPNGHMNIVKYFLDGKRSIAERPDLILSACKTGQLSILKYLIELVGFSNFKTEDYYNLIFEAIYNGQLLILKYLIEDLKRLMNLRAVDLNKTNELGKTMLWNAVHRHKDTIVEYLIQQAEIDVNFSESRCESALNLAACKGFSAIVKILLSSKKIDVNKTDRLENFPLFAASHHGDKETVRLLLELKEIDVNKSNIHGKSSLFIASQKGHLEIVKLLVECEEIDLDKLDDKSQTPLYVACSTGKLAAAKLLVENGANIEKANRIGNTPLMIASRWHPSIVAYLISKGANVNTVNKDKRNPLFFAVSTNNIESVKALIDERSDFNAIDKFNLTPVFIAEKNGHFPVLKFLVDAGCDVSVKNSQGKSLLMLCCGKKSSSQLIKFLVNEKGCDVNAVDNDGNSALHIAIENFQLETAKVLIQLGANLQIRNGLGETPVFVAARSPSYPFVKYFFENFTFDLNAPRNDGMTPLHLLLSFGFDYYDTLKYLVEVVGANVNAKNSKGETPLFFVWQLDVLKYLIGKGADWTVKNIKGENVLTIASTRQNSAMVAYLLELGAQE